MAARSPLPPQPPGVWAALLDASTDLLALLDAAGTIVWANAACQRAADVESSAALLGLTPAQALTNLRLLEDTQRLLHSNVQEALALEVAMLRLDV